jgi:hypothetical protein
VDGPRIHLNLGLSPAAVDVVGLDGPDLAMLKDADLSREQWSDVLRVRVITGDATATPAAGQPSVLGTHSVADAVVRFVPQFPFEPGIRYLVEFDARASGPNGDEGRDTVVTATVQVPLPTRHTATRIVGVYPSSPVLPENQLRLYIVFSAPMGLLDGAPFIRLLDEHGKVVVDPFLPLDVNLWNEDRTRYTVLFDPGRQKRGILPNEQMGRSLIEGKTYSLVVDAEWRDGAGQSLETPLRREFRVGPAQEHAIDPSQWRLDAPAAGTRDPLCVTFPRPLDYALLHRAMRVVTKGGEAVEGDLRLERAETRWVFTPRDTWQADDFQLLAASTLEDVAGNRIGRPFEVSMLHVTYGSGTRDATGAAVPFRVRPHAR